MDVVTFSKVLTWLAYPTGFAALLLLSALFFKFTHRQRLCRAAWGSAGCVLIISSNPVFASWLAETLESRYKQYKTADYEYHQALVVLGGGLVLPLSPSTRPQLGAAGDRYWCAAELYLAKRAERVFLAGGNVYAQIDEEGRTLAGEASYAAGLLQKWGVPEGAIESESVSRTTSENKALVAKHLKKYEVKSALLVTSAMHMPRAMMTFTDLPIKLTPAPCDFRVLRSNSPAVFDWIPSASALALTTQALHEYYGMSVLSVSRALKAFNSKG